MTRPRSSIICLESAQYYHCVSRCVRRAYLCGKDSNTGKNFNHRKKWCLDRLKTLASVFSIDIAAYAFMSNHYHLVLHVNVDAVKNWSLKEVINRWCRLFYGPYHVQKYRAGQDLTPAELKAVEITAEVWRERLMSISWFIRCFNEHIARKANAEDDCTGRFWEGRFKSQALLDEKAIVSCMAYVDLNPVRAQMAKTPEESAFTSIQARIAEHSPEHLMPMDESKQYENIKGISFSLHEYIELVDWTGRQIKQGKEGFINPNQPPMLERLGLKTDNWGILTTSFESKFQYFIGGRGVMEEVKKVLNYLRMPGVKLATSLFGY